MLSDLQATQGVIVLNGTTSRPWGALLSIVVTNAYVLYSVIEEISSSSQVSLDLWTQQLRMFSTYQRSLVLLFPMSRALLLCWIMSAFLSFSYLLHFKKTNPYHLFICTHFSLSSFLILSCPAPPPHAKLPHIRKMFYLNFN